MKKPVFLEQVRLRMFQEGISHEAAAEYLHITQTTFSRKLAGKHPFTYDEAELLKELLGLMTPQSEEADPSNPRPRIVKQVMEGMPEDDQKKLCAGIAWVLEDKESRLKPESQDALRALRALR